MKCPKCKKEMELDTHYGFYCFDCEGKPGIDFEYEWKSLKDLDENLKKGD